MVGIIDYGMGNLQSVFNAVEHLGYEARICPRPEDLKGCSHYILPGVGAFRDCMARLHAAGLPAALEEHVRRGNHPILGICLGMQAMARSSEEGGTHAGLGWFAADVIRIRPDPPTLRIPHVGWNSTHLQPGCPLFRGLPAEADFYFVHSYHMRCDRKQDCVAWCDHGGPVTAAVHRGNIFATQFHPEKSQENGLRVLENFLTWNG
jgi:glutamine amidotransferase